MVYLFTNITDSSSDPKTIAIGDVPGRPITYVKPGQTIDLELISNRNQICESHMIKVHALEGRATIDTLGTEPNEGCRIWVAGIGIGDLNIEKVGIDEPIAISGFVGPTETPINATTFSGITSLNTNPVLPDTPSIIDVAINTANTEASVALPANTRRFEILLLEEDADLEMSFVSNGNTWPIPCGASYSTTDINANNTMLYFKTDKAPRTVKVLTWSIA